MATEMKQYTGLQKVLKQAAKAGVCGDHGEPLEILSRAIDVSRKTILNWLRADGVSLTEPTTIDNAVSRAVTAHGGPVAVGKLLGVTYQAVTQWIAQGYVPNKRVAEFSIQFGVPRNDILSPKVRNAAGVGGEL